MAVKKPRTYAETLEALRSTRDDIKKLEGRKATAEKKRDELIKHAASFSESSGGVIAKSAGLSAGRVSQITPVRAQRAAVRAAQAAGVIGSTTAPAEVPAPRLSDAAAKMAARLTEIHGVGDYVAKLETAVKGGPRELPGIGDTPVTIEAGSASKRKWTAQRARFTAVAAPDGRIALNGKMIRVDPGDGSPGAWLAVLPEQVERLVFVGDAPWHTDRDTTMTADVHEWLTAPLPEGWVGKSHFPHERYPVGRYEWTGGQKRRVEFSHLGSWVPGSNVTHPMVGWHAFRLLREAIQTRWDTKVELTGSPTTLGQDLWARTIPQGREYPIMSAELRELIRTTSGQGRFELFAAHGGAEKLPALNYYDCTFAYAGLTWGLPVGSPTRVTAHQYETANAALQEKMVRGRGRWHIRATVPTDWAHVGLLPCSGTNGWEYPREPGRTFTTWASGGEVWLARQRGWHIEVIDGITWAEGKPLDLWRDKLVDAWRALNSMSSMAGPGYAEAAALAAKMARSVLLYTIGGFHSRGVQKKGLAASEAAIPATAVRAEERDGTWEWQGGREVTSEFAHPEWSAEVYGRMRLRLLAGPQGVGALQLPYESMVAFRADGLLTTAESGWTNPDAVPGRFRLKGKLGECPAPTDEGSLLALRDAAESAL